uniref:P2X purinoceptor n=1 Tax=Eptatretus burgeri TaxID=7764 RepID=A0A8C4QWY6_EPTBU
MRFTRQGLGDCFWTCVAYETTKDVVIKNRTVGFISRLLQLLLITYFVGWVFLTEKAYQSFEKLTESSVISKVKGIDKTISDNGQFKIWDVAEYVTPPQGRDGFCIITNSKKTNQREGNCPELPKVPGAKCKTDKDCQQGDKRLQGNGVRTGRCINFDKKRKTCEVTSWCPLEDGPSRRRPMLPGAENFTILIKNSVRFARFNVHRSNMKDDVKKKYLHNCLHNPDTDNYCPIFRLGDVVLRAGQNFRKLASQGGKLAIHIQWACNLDHGTSACHPNYGFKLLDAVPPLSDLRSGYSFKYGEKNMMENGERTRNLFQLHSICIDIIVSGEAGKFDVVPTLISIASALTSIGMGSILCDFILLSCVKQKKTYQEHKFDTVVLTDDSKNGEQEMEMEKILQACDLLNHVNKQEYTEHITTI